MWGDTELFGEYLPVAAGLIEHEDEVRVFKHVLSRVNVQKMKKDYRAWIVPVVCSPPIRLFCSKFRPSRTRTWVGVCYAICSFGTFKKRIYRLTDRLTIITMTVNISVGAAFNGYMFSLCA